MKSAADGRSVPSVRKSATLFVQAFRRDASDDNHVAVVVCRDGCDAIVEQRILLSLGPPVAVLRLRRNAGQCAAVVLARRRRIDLLKTTGTTSTAPRFRRMTFAVLHRE